MSCVPLCCGFVVCAITGPTNTGKRMLAVDVLRRVGGRGSKNNRFYVGIPWKSIDFEPGQSRDGFGTVLPSTSVRGVARATRIDNEGQTVRASPHRFSTVWAWSHETRLFVKRCGRRGTH